MIHIAVTPEFATFRQRCRELLAANVPPAEVFWSESDVPQLSLLPSGSLTEIGRASLKVPSLKVPRPYFELARLVCAHRDSQRWHLLYSVLWRIKHGEPHLLSVHTDDEVLRLTRMRQEIARDIHHMHAFVRFRSMEREGHEWFVAWYRPDHRVLRLAAPFFAERFAAMRWSILTPDESVHWDGTRLHYLAGVPLSSAPDEDALESLWSTYYRSTFNPARMNLELMRQEMPARFWANLPEVQNLPNVVAEAPARLATMHRQRSYSALPVVPETRDLEELHRAASTCTACPLHCEATQTVFGAGSASSRVVLIGEQPGDLEDVSGVPFVGPAGEVLARALVEAGIPRSQVYMTNAVKHFKFVREGKRRIHQTPRMSEIMACKPWLEAELDSIRPHAIVLLGATAAKSLLGSTVRITRDAGKVLPTRWAEHTVITVHPSFVLRTGDDRQSRLVFERLVADLATVQPFVAQRSLEPAL